MSLDSKIIDSSGTNKGLAVNEFNRAEVQASIENQALGRGDLITDVWGVQKVSRPVSLFSARFTYDVDPSEWFTFENGTETASPTNITSSEGAAQLLADATYTNVTLQSRQCPRYQGNRGHLFSTALWCPTRKAAGIREWGVYINGSTSDGVFFRLKSDGFLYAVLVRDSEEREARIRTELIPGFDVTKNNTYDIAFQWRSAGDYFFYIGDKNTRQSRLVHVIKNLGEFARVSMVNPALPAHYYVERTGSDDVYMNVGCVDITSENGDRDAPENYVSAYAEAVSVSTDTPVIVLYNPTSINSMANTRDMHLLRISFTCSKKGVFKVWTTRDGTAITGDTTVAIGNGCYVECDSTDMSGSAVRATSVTTSSMALVTAVPVEAATPREVDNPFKERIHFHIVRGDYLVVTCTAATASADVVVEFGDQR